MRFLHNRLHDTIGCLTIGYIIQWVACRMGRNPTIGRYTTYHRLQFKWVACLDGSLFYNRFSFRSYDEMGCQNDGSQFYNRTLDSLL